MGACGVGRMDHGVDLHVHRGDRELLHDRSTARELDEGGILRRGAEARTGARTRSAALSVVGVESSVFPDVEHRAARARRAGAVVGGPRAAHPMGNRKSTRLNSSHANISYAVFCLKKKKKKTCI